MDEFNLEETINDFYNIIIKKKHSTTEYQPFDIIRESNKVDTGNNRK